MTRFLLRAAIVASVAGFAMNDCVAETISLRCSGSVFLRGQNPPELAVNDHTFTVDTDAGLVHGFLGGPYRISKIDRDAINIWSRFVFQDGGEGLVQGAIDRATGKTYLMSYRDAEPNNLVIYYELICRAAKQLF